MNVSNIQFVRESGGEQAIYLVLALSPWVILGFTGPTPVILTSMSLGLQCSSSANFSLVSFYISRFVAIERRLKYTIGSMGEYDLPVLGVHYSCCP